MHLKKFLWSFFLMSAFHTSRGQERIWFDQEAKIWEEALPIGNGHLGAMIYGNVIRDEIQFNEETLWTDGPRAYNKKGASTYLPKIRELLDQGLQKEAEDLAQWEFMGLKSRTDDTTSWLRKMSKMREKSDGPSSAIYNDSDWSTIQVPHYDGWELQGLEGLHGAVWFRQEFTLSEEDLKQEWLLDLNKIRTNDYTYINGTEIGSSKGDDIRRQYIIPKNILKCGRNSIAIQVINLEGKGGIAGYKDFKQPIGLLSKQGKFIRLNTKWKYKIQDKNSPKIGTYQASYQPFGSLFLKFDHDEYTGYKRVLDLSKGEVRMSYQVDDLHFKRTYFASHPNNFIGIKIEADQKKQISFRMSLKTKHQDFRIWKLNATSFALEVKVKDGAMKGTAYTKIDLKGGELSSTDDEIIVHDADEVTICLMAATNFESFQTLNELYASTALKNFKQLQLQDFESMYKQHGLDYKQYYNRFSITLGSENFTDTIPTDRRLHRSVKQKDPGLIALYVQYARYLQIAASRAGSQPMNLQGIWNQDLEPSWGSKYTSNINLEMNYWPSEVLNLSEMQQPLFQMIHDLSIAGKVTAKEYYNARGWVLHHNTDIWRGTAPINNANHGIWPTGGAWLVRHLWEHYLYSKDIQFLNQYYPIIKQATLFFKDFLVRDTQTGWYISSPSNSPENGGLVKGPTMDHQIIRSLFDIFCNTAFLLKKDEALKDSIATIRNHLAPNQIGQYGQLQEWLTDIDDKENKHRHVSHLWGLYPGDEINFEQTDQLMQAAKKSLEVRGDEGTGWSLAWKINFWARLKDPQHSYHMIKMLLRPADKEGGSYPNLFDAHPPFQIDGNFGGASGIMEMLIQSHTDYIDLLPTLPKELGTGKVIGMKARGNFTLDLEWSNMQIATLTVHSLSGEDLQLRCGDKNIKIKTVKGRSYVFDRDLKLRK